MSHQTTARSAPRFFPGQHCTQKSNDVVDRFGRQLVLDHPGYRRVDVLEAQIRQQVRAESGNKLALDVRSVARLRTTTDLSAAGKPRFGERFEG